MNTEIKVVLVGDGKVGKTSLVKKCLTDEFETKYVPTLGVEVYPFNNYNIWDTAGQDRFGGLRDGYYVDANIICIVISQYMKNLQRSLDGWYNLIMENTTKSENCSIVIILTHRDLGYTSKLSYIRNYAVEKNLPLMEISNKSVTANEVRRFLDSV